VHRSDGRADLFIRERRHARAGEIPAVDAMNVVTAAAQARQFTCRPSDSLLTAAETCLDNGVGVCFVVDAQQRLLGQVTLTQIRQAIATGADFGDHGIARLLEQGKTCGRTAGTRALSGPEDPPVTPVIADDGRLVDVIVDRSRQFIQVAQPDLSRDELRAVLDALLSTWISSKGAYIEAFEREFAAFVGTRRAVAVSNGTVALHLALLALGVGPGDEVIVPDLTFAATINAVLYCGATPVIVDVAETTWTMSLKGVERACTARTKAVIPVHLYGRPAEIGPIAEFAKRKNIFVVEDCAEAHGAKYAGRVVGRFSDISCFSFYGNKIVTTGEGGMCLTDSDELAAVMLELRSHGMKPERGYWHDRVGFNYRMTNLQAAVGVMQLRKIGRTLARNERLQRLYCDRLAAVPGVSFAPALPAACEPVVWLACALVPPDKRDRLIEAAKRVGAELRPFFHRLSEMPPYRSFAETCPVAARLARTGINLPTSSAVDEPAVDKVVGVFKEILGA
jgi:perosamine synthetase